MYHRFGEGYGAARLDPRLFEQQILFLKKKYRISRLADLVGPSRSGRFTNCAVLTVDDGYRDFLEVAYPILVKHQVPATLYVVSAFAEGGFWLWFDALRHTFLHAKTGKYILEVGNKERLFDLMSEAQRLQAWSDIADCCLELGTKERDRYIRYVIESLEVDLPEVEASDFAALSWEDLRSLDPEYVEIGSHSHRHPILSHCSDDELVEEIQESKRLIEQNTSRKIAAFCYPNGQPADYDSRSFEILRCSGYESAVLAHGGLSSEKHNVFELPRIGSVSEMNYFRNEVSGLYDLKRRLRGAINAT